MEMETDEVVVLEIEPRDLRLVVYLINSGVLRIREASVCATLDCMDKKTVSYGQELLKLLGQQYRELKLDAA
jgi:hypothetical protein